jgi:hypothetical protein
MDIYSTIIIFKFGNLIEIHIYFSHLKEFFLFSIIIYLF